MYIIHKGLQGSQPFKCAVFFSTIKVHDPTAFERKGVVMPLIPAEAGQLIRIPTVHIWGEKDPGHRDSEDLKMLCDQQQATAVIHSGGHEVPGLGKSSEVSGIVNAVRRAIFLSSLSAV
jgi:predicted esterase